MQRYLLRRLISTVFSLYIIITITFFLMKVIPGNPFLQEKAIPEEILQAMYAHYHLNDPWYLQYLYYLRSIVTWDLGPSFKYPGRTVNEIIEQGFPVSAALGTEALLLALCFGVTFGIVAAFNQNRWKDWVVMLIAILGLSIPSFILAACLQYLIAMKWNLLPVARWGSFSQSILPAISLAVMPIAFIARLTRSNFIEVWKQEYIKTAKSKGLSSFAIIWRHAFKNALLPVVGYLGPLTANILTGSFVVEQIFGIPGLGQWFVTSITNRDYTVIMGTTVFYSLILLLAVFLMDLLYCWLDPRIRLEER